MFKVVQQNVIESDEGLSIEIHWREKIIYRRQGHTLVVGGEMQVYLKERYHTSEDQYGFMIYLSSIKHWEKPYENETIDAATRDSIIDDIARALEFTGRRCETDAPPTIEELNRRYQEYKSTRKP